MYNCPKCDDELELTGEVQAQIVGEWIEVTVECTCGCYLVAWVQLDHMEREDDEE